MVGLRDFLVSAEIVANRDQRLVEMFLFVALVYFVFCFIFDCYIFVVCCCILLFFDTYAAHIVLVAVPDT